MTRWQPLPHRQPGEVISVSEYRAAGVPPQVRTDVLLTTFRHRDNRIWNAQITHATDHYLVGDDGDQSAYSYSISLTSAGCRSHRFLSASLDQAKRTVNRFANLGLQQYSRLVADATGTTEHPRPGDVGVFRMRIVNRQREAGSPQFVERDGIAYNDGVNFVVFPTSRELFEILSRVCATNTTAIIPQGINQISETAQANSFIGPNNSIRVLGIPGIADEEALAAVTRLQDDTADAIMEGIKTGAYVSTPRQREERVLDIF